MPFIAVWDDHEVADSAHTQAGRGGGGWGCGAAHSGEVQLMARAAGRWGKSHAEQHKAQEMEHPPARRMLPRRAALRPLPARLLVPVLAGLGGV